MSDSINPYAPPAVDVLPPVDPAKHERLASRKRRLAASLLDTLILMVILMPLMGLSGYFTRSMAKAAHGYGASFDPEGILWGIGGLLIMIAVNWNHLAVGESIGKRALRIRVVRQNGEMADRRHLILWRILPLQLASFIPYLGALVVFVDVLFIFRSGRNTLHDDIADTKVVDLRPVSAA